MPCVVTQMMRGRRALTTTTTPTGTTRGEMRGTTRSAGVGKRHRRGGGRGAVGTTGTTVGGGNAGRRLEGTTRRLRGRVDWRRRRLAAVGVSSSSSSSERESAENRLDVNLGVNLGSDGDDDGERGDESEISGNQRNAAEATTPRRKARTRAEREASAESYEWSAWASSCGVTSIAITATYFRILREVDVNGGVFPVAELVAQLALIAGAAVGMEFYARYAHKHLWHGSWWSMSSKYRREWNKPIWLLHESHHLPREGAFEANDVFALVNGVPAFALCAYGFFTPGVFGGLCFGAGLGITLYGIAYMYVHDGLVHKRFPTGPLGKLPLMRKIAAGHTIHHTEAFEGVPWGLFLGIQELEAVPGGIAELDKVVAAAERKDARDEQERLARETVGLVTQGEHIPSMKEAPQCKLPGT